jgi:hypothetical protein
MAGYTRQSTFTDGDIIQASDFNDEYNQLVNVFSNSTGHAHDGTAGEGPVIGLIGDPGAATPKNKVVVDDTNERVGFFIDVSGTSTEQFRVQDGVIVPVTTNDVDLGTSSLKFKDAYFAGDVTANNINSTAFNGDLIPDTDDTRDIGSTTKEWKDLYLDGVAYLDTINLNGTAITSTAAELNILDGVTSTAAELNILDGVTSTTAELNILDGVTATATEINTLDGITSTTAELNILDGVTADATELNILDGATVTTTELNLLDGVTSTTAELNIVDGTTTATATTVAAADRVVLNDAGTMVQVAVTDLDTYFSGTTKTLTNKTLTSAVLNTGVSGTAILDEDNMASDSATQLATQQSIKAYVDSQVQSKDALSELSGDSDDITEGTTNLFFTNERVDDRVDSLLTAGTNITLTYDDTANTLTIASTDTGITDVVDDTTPQLGGDLDVNGSKITSASNGDIDIEPNGTGNVLLGNFEFDVDQTVGAGQDNYVLTYDNSTGHISLEAAASGGISDVVSDTTPQLGGNLDTNSNNIEFGDNDKAIFGAGTDLQVYHAGSSINHIVGLVGSSTYITGGTDLYLRGVNGEEGVTINGNGAVELFHDNVKKLETVTGGVTVTGTATATAFVGDGSGLTNLPSAGITQAQADAGATALAIALG